ncbi:MAG: ABC transporter permease [Bacteroidia bacterium]|nr:ABC transporter permease [Bacteroidia bacterium]
MTQLGKIIISDFKLIFRDPTLKIFLFLPILIFVVIDLLIPMLVERFPVTNDFVSFILIVATVEVTQMFGLIYSLVLIDEKETEVSKIYGVLPVSQRSFILSRFLVPVLITIMVSWLLLITQPFYDLSLYTTLLFSILAGLIVPVYALGVSILSKNRLEGMVWIKVFNVIVVVPVAAFFLPAVYSWFFVLFPTHWAFQGLLDIIQGQAFLLNLMIGAGLLILLTFFCRTKVFKKSFCLVDFLLNF